MFKKLKDKLAEEVKSSPQRLQQFAQAAQAAVTSASSSISDITNSDLFSITDNENQQGPNTSQTGKSQISGFEDVSLMQPTPVQSFETLDFTSNNDNEHQRLRRLSNSSFTSDVSFRLPNYESPSVFHLQSDMEVSASEAEERNFTCSNVNLDRVTKEQLYTVYKRTQERYKKYRTQYADLARHYKLLERENAKARGVLVETQDKALRRISELKEQCALEQSAKAHLEKALRVELEEKNLIINTLNTKITLLQPNNETVSEKHHSTDNVAPLIDFNTKQVEDAAVMTELNSLNVKIEKLEQLNNKYKESLKNLKEKNSQITLELQIASKEIDSKNKEIEALHAATICLTEAREKIKELNDHNEELQNKINSYDFSKTKEMSVFETDLLKAREEISELRCQIEVFTKREEEYAISLAENKLSIHKELEDKEAEIKSLKEILANNEKEINSVNIIINEYKNRVASLEKENVSLKNKTSECDALKSKIKDHELQIEEINKKYHSAESTRIKMDEENKCLQLQIKQEIAEKLAMQDRNDYLNTRNLQLSDENEKKCSKIITLENELNNLNKRIDSSVNFSEIEKQNLEEKKELLEECDKWKTKCANLESEIQEEREELVKLQAEIENLLSNHEHIQTKNEEFQLEVEKLKSENKDLHSQLSKNIHIIESCKLYLSSFKALKQTISVLDREVKKLRNDGTNIILKLSEEVQTLTNYIQTTNDSELQVSNLKAQCNESTKQFNELHEQLSNSLNDVSTLQIQNQHLESQISKYNLENMNLKESLEALEKKLVDFQKIKCDLNDCQEKLIKMENYSQSLQDIIVSAEQQSLSQNKLIKELEEKLKNLANKDKTNLSELSNLKKSLQENLSKLEDSGNRCQVLESKIAQDAVNNTSLTNDLKEMENKLKHVNDQCELSLQEYRKKCEELQTRVTESENEYHLLQSQITQNKNQEAYLKQVVEDLKDMQIKYENCSQELFNTKNECNELKLLMENVEIKNKDLQNIVNKSEDSKALLENDKQTLEKEKVFLNNKLHSLEENNESLMKELDQLKMQYEKNISDSSIQKEDFAKISAVIKTKEGNIVELKEINELLVKEKKLLQDKSDTVINDCNQLKIELADLRNSQMEMETERDRLNLIIEKLQKNPITQNAEIVNNVEKHFNESTNSQTINTNKDFDKYETLKTEHDSMKDENKRLQSDIEGLQTYLKKISKENSDLNNKLRELLASSDSLPSKGEVLDNINLIGLNSEIQTGKDRIESLVRENAFLIEENLELKDQLETQRYADITSENKSIQDNVNMSDLQLTVTRMREEKFVLEKKVSDMEILNTSINNNLLQMQENNEKLRKSNEKLGRRLDEALVSLRHLHSLQENTELEYLRNILYEYLTGAGTHSITLAKVLSAVVKFDDKQTQQVLQKEKERQGLLRQLGLT